jgi:hypothetical protein
MRRAGHERLADGSDKEPDFTILVLSNYTPDSLLQTYAQSDQRLICVTASALDDWSRYKPLARSQWVDYRRQQRNRLAAMALDILNIGGQKTGYSFSTQQTPESFNKTILPNRAASGIGCMYISIYITAATLVLGLLYPVSSASTLLSVIVTIIMVPVYIWLMIRVTRREIGLWMLILIGLLIAVINSVIGSLLGISVYQTGLVNLIVLVVVLNVIVSYPIYRATVGSWLPVGLRRLPPLAFRRDRSQWGFHLALVVLAGLLSLTFFFNRFEHARTPPNDSLRPVSYENQFTMNVPAYWYPADSPDYRNALTRTQILAQALGRVSLTFGQSAVKTINQMLNGGLSPVIIPSDPIEQDAQLVGFKLVSDARYVPDAAQTSRTLRFDLWVYPRGFLYTGESRVYFAVFADDQAFTPLQPVDETAVSGQIQRLEQRFSFQETMPNGAPVPLEFRLDIFETPAAAFLLSFVGDSETMQAESSAIDKILASAQVNVEPAPPAAVTLDRLRFDVPAIWETVMIPDMNTPSTWQGAAPDDITTRFLQHAQAKYDQFTLPIQVVWGARVFSFHKPVFIALARVENATPNDLGRILDALKQQDSQLTGVQPASDDLAVVRADYALRIITFEFTDSEVAEWYAGLYVNGQAYLVVIASDPTTLAGYGATLTDWLTSFQAS